MKKSTIIIVSLIVLVVVVSVIVRFLPPTGYSIVQTGKTQPPSQEVPRTLEDVKKLICPGYDTTGKSATGNSGNIQPMGGKSRKFAADAG